MTEKKHIEQWITKTRKERSAKFKGHELEAELTNGVKLAEAEHLAELRNMESRLEKIFGPFDELQKKTIDATVSLHFRVLLYSYQKELIYEKAYYKEQLAEVTKERDRLKSQSNN